MTVMELTEFNRMYNIKKHMAVKQMILVILRYEVCVRLDSESLTEVETDEIAIECCERFECNKTRYIELAKKYAFEKASELYQEIIEEMCD